MSPLNWLWRTGAAWVTLVIAGSIAGAVVPLTAPVLPHVLVWWLVSNLVTTAALAFAAGRADWRGMRLGFGLAVVPVLTGSVSMIEGAVFLGNSRIPWKPLTLNLLLTYGLAAPVWGFIFTVHRSQGLENYRPFDTKSIVERLWRYVASAFCYLFLYFVAGSIIFPLVRNFYATQTLPPVRTVVMLQLFLRGPVFVAVCLLLLRMVGFARCTGPVAVGVIFAVISGVAPLLMPNPFLPDAVRWVHLCEVTSSDFLFGAFVAWLWGRSRRVSVVTQPA